MLARVKDGTDAGLKMGRRTVPVHGWRCQCGHDNPRFAATCLAFGCRQRRSKEKP